MDLAHLARIGLFAAHSRAVPDTQPSAKPAAPSSQVSDEELLLLASQTSERKPRCSYPSCLPDWPSWSSRHPQRDVVAALQTGRGALPQQAKCISLVSWNVLAQHYLQLSRDRGEYSQSAPECLEPATRHAAVLEWLAGLSPTLISLQEVDQGRYHDDFEVPLQAQGYQGCFQKRDKYMGCATFWRTDHFRLVRSEARSRTLLVGLVSADSPEDTPELVMVNCHLDSAQELQKSRAKNISNSLQTAAKWCADAALIVAGDFNVNPDNALPAVLRDHKWHGFHVASVYEHPAAAQTSPVVETTCAANPYRDLFDYIWYRHSRLRLRMLLEPLSDMERRTYLPMDGPGLPNAPVPSDHIPIGATFEFIPQQVDLSKIK